MVNQRMRGPVVGLLLFVATGCNRGPVGPVRPTFDPSWSGSETIALYDQDDNGKIDGSELERCPAIKLALERLDQDGDRAVSAVEMSARVNHYQSCSTTILSRMATVALDGSPLPDATVTFEPEAFMGSAFKPVSGITNQSGSVNVTGHDSAYPGIHMGFYRVRISKLVDGQEMVPARYNVESELGYEASSDVFDDMGIIHFRLTSD